MIIYIENLKEHTPQNSRPIEFSNTIGNKINVSNQFYFYILAMDMWTSKLKV